MRDIGTNIRTRREAKGWTQEQLAKEAGMPVDTLRKAEQKSERRPRNIADIAAALGCSVAELEYGTSPAPAAPETRIEYDPEATADPNLVASIASEYKLSRDQAERFKAMRWSVGLPSRATLQSYARDLAEGVSRSPDRTEADASRAQDDDGRVDVA